MARARAAAMDSPAGPADMVVADAAVVTGVPHRARLRAGADDGVVVVVVAGAVAGVLCTLAANRFCARRVCSGLFERHLRMLVMSVGPPPAGLDGPALRYVGDVLPDILRRLAVCGDGGGTRLLGNL